MTNKEKLMKYKAATKQIESLALGTVKSDPWVPISLGGRVYKLEFSYGAAVEIFRTTGVAIGYEPVDPKMLMGSDVLPVVLMAGLQTHHANAFASGDEIMRLIPIRHLNYIAGILALALQAVEPDAEELADITEALASIEDPQPPLALSGTTSSSGLSAGNLEYPMPKLVE